MPKLNAAQKSTKNVLTNANRLRRAQNYVWKTAKTNHVFTKTNENGKTRYTRLIKPIAYKIAVSGACQTESALNEIEMKRLGVEVEPDSKQCPWTCSLAPGAVLPIEMFLASVVQQILLYNKVLKTSLKKKRNDRHITKISIDEVKKAIFDPAAGVPTSTIVLPYALARKKKAGETEAPGEREAEDVKEADEDEEEEEQEEDGEEAE